jgi:hypothetical protein
MNFNKFDGLNKKYPLDEKIVQIYFNKEWDLKKDAEIELRELRTKCDEVL